MLKTILNSMNLYNLPKGICSVLIGCASAAFMGSLEIVPATLTLIFVILIQISVNLQNVYCELHYDRTSIVDVASDGTEIVVSKNMEIPLKMLSMIFGILAMTSGLGLASIGGWPALLLGVLIFGTVLFYNKRNFSIRFSKAAPFVVFFFYGPVAVIGSYLLQMYNYSDYPFNWNYIWFPVFLSPIMGFFACNVWLFGERKRNILLPDKAKGYFTGTRAKLLKKLFLVNSILILVSQVFLGIYTINGYFCILAFILAGSCFVVNMIVWHRGKNTLSSAVELRNLAFCVLGNMIFYSFSTLMWCAIFHLSPEITSAEFF